MRKYKINRDKPLKEPSKEAIEKYKDFSRLSHEYDRLTRRPKVPIYKDKKMFLVLLLIMLIVFVLTQVIDEEEKDTEEGVNSTQIEQVED